MNNTDFDNWVDTYESDIYLKKDKYPFEGYFDNVEIIEKAISQKESCRVLDLGIGTGMMHEIMSSKINYALHCIDFSKRMCQYASKRLKDCQIINGNLIDPVPPIICNNKYDLIISAYCLHHFSDLQKLEIITKYSELLAQNGIILIADIGFDTIELKSEAKTKAGTSWDADEENGYMVKADAIKLYSSHFNLEYKKTSSCSVIYTLSRLI